MSLPRRRRFPLRPITRELSHVQVQRHPKAKDGWSERVTWSWPHSDILTMVGEDTPFCYPLSSYWPPASTKGPA